MLEMQFGQAGIILKVISAGQQIQVRFLRQYEYHLSDILDK